MKKTDRQGLNLSSRIVGLACILVSVAAYITFHYQHDKRALFAQFTNEQTANLKVAESLLDDAFTLPERDVRYIDDLLTRQGMNVYGVASHFAAMISVNKAFYSQIRLLNVSGHEVVRVQHDNGVVRITSDDQLQDKSDRYYFHAAQTLKKGQVWFSPIDLNVENGEIEQPYQPTMRMIMPYFHRRFERVPVGYIVINLNLTHLFERIQKTITANNTVWLTNDRGYWLIGPEEKTWGFMLPGGENNTLAINYPKIWESIRSVDQSSYQDKRLFTSNWYSASSVFEEPEHIVFDAKSERYGLLSLSQENQLGEAWADIRKQALIQFFLLSTIALAVYIFIWRQLSSRAKLSAQLGTEKEKLAHMLQTAPDGILVCERDGTITYANDQCLHLFGYRPDELIGEKVEMLVPDSVRGSHPDKRDQMSYGHGARSMGSGTDFKARRKDGSLLDVDINLNIYPEELGGATLAVVRDVTVLKAAERRTDEALKAAELSGRARADFLANMSHEIRTPMNGITGMLNLLLDTTLNDRQRHFATQSKNSADSLLRIINDILDISKIDSGRLEIIEQDIDLEQVLLDVGRTLEPLAQQKEIELYCPRGIAAPMHVSGDPVRLRQIMMNLIGNAIKFTEQGYVEVAIDFEINDDHVDTVISVRDTGIGMDNNTLNSVFERFTQADSSTTRKAGGTGLGLAITRDLVELMNGRIEAESTSGTGSCFNIFLTFNMVKAYAQYETCQSNAALYSYVSTQKQHELLAELCQSWQLNCTRVEAISEFVKTAPEEAVLLLDLATLKSSDIAALEMRKDTLKGIVLMHSSNLDINQKIADLVTTRLIKPIAPSELFNTINRLLGGIKLSQANEDEAAGTRLSTLTGKVLLVEDDFINREVATAVLQKFGIQVVAAMDGNEAIRVLNEQDIDLVLMDCQMPVMDGYTATRQIREGAAGHVNKTIPIIALTANALRGDQELCLDAGMDDYLSKPLEPFVLHEMMDKHLKKLVA